MLTGLSLPRKARGFSLVELAIGIVIVAALLSGLLVPLATQMEERRTAETKRMLEAARDALVTFAAANGRLPCPASATSNGAESFVAGSPPGSAADGRCSDWVGFLPAATLGLSPVDRCGYSVDPFGQQGNLPPDCDGPGSPPDHPSKLNRIRYAVSNTTINGQTNPFTRVNGMRLATINAIASNAGLLTVCTTGGNCSGTGNVMLTNGGGIAVIYSAGRNALSTGAPGSAGTDEAENLDGDGYFVSRPVSDVPGNEFDDILLWISPAVLFGPLIQAGTLP
jgi:prepilin-type N-terminal cleavage/methylation domain-containing protein